MSDNKIALFFGSFNPVHFGHIKIAEKIPETKFADKVWFVLSPQNPLKNTKILADEKHRLKMLKIAINENEKFQLCEDELNMEKPSYTYKTLNFLKQKYPHLNFKIIIGADILEQLDKWVNYKQIIDNYEFIIYPRNNVLNIGKYKNLKYQTLKFPEINISSTQIRNNIKNGLDNSEYLPKEIISYIIENKLYI